METTTRSRLLHPIRYHAASLLDIYPDPRPALESLGLSDYQVRSVLSHPENQGTSVALEMDHGAGVLVREGDAHQWELWIFAADDGAQDQALANLQLLLARMTKGKGMWAVVACPETVPRVRKHVRAE